MPNPHSPLDDTHLAQIKNALGNIDRAEAQILLAKQAGIDVSKPEQTLMDQRKRLLAIKNTYFPNS